MKCLECGNEVQIIKDNYYYDECGLKGVLLIGVPHEVCMKCNTREALIPAIEQLHNVLMREIATAPGPLNPEEIRFLRKSKGWSSKDCAEKLMIDKSTLSRIEKGDQNMGASLEKLLRYYVLNEEPIYKYDQNKIKTNRKLCLLRNEETWSRTC